MLFLITAEHFILAELKHRLLPFFFSFQGKYSGPGREENVKAPLVAQGQLTQQGSCSVKRGKDLPVPSEPLSRALFHHPGCSITFKSCGCVGNAGAGCSSCSTRSLSVAAACGLQSGRFIYSFLERFHWERLREQLGQVPPRQRLWARRVPADVPLPWARVPPRLALPRSTSHHAFLCRLSGRTQVTGALSGGDSCPKSAHRQVSPALLVCSPVRITQTCCCSLDYA